MGTGAGWGDLDGLHGRIESTIGACGSASAGACSTPWRWVLYDLSHFDKILPSCESHRECQGRRLNRAQANCQTARGTRRPLYGYVVILSLVGFATSFGAHIVATNLPACPRTMGVGAPLLAQLLPCGRSRGENLEDDADISLSRFFQIFKAPAPHLL